MKKIYFDYLFNKVMKLLQKMESMNINDDIANKYDNEIGLISGKAIAIMNKIERQLGRIKDSIDKYTA